MLVVTRVGKVTYNWGIHKAINLEEANRQRKLAREEEKEKDEDLEKVNNHIFDKERCSLGLI